MLDMSVRAKILELMLSLKQDFDLTYLYITHDLATAKFFCDRIAIMYLGRIVEIGPSEAIYEDPKHPYTQALLRAIPEPDPRRAVPRDLPRGEVPGRRPAAARLLLPPALPARVRGLRLGGAATCATCSSAHWAAAGAAVYEAERPLFGDLEALAAVGRDPRPARRRAARPGTTCSRSSSACGRPIRRSRSGRACSRCRPDAGGGRDRVARAGASRRLVPSGPGRGGVPPLWLGPSTSAHAGARRAARRRRAGDPGAAGRAARGRVGRRATGRGSGPRTTTGLGAGRGARRRAERRLARHARGDPVEEARAYLGSPYEWGGMTEAGIDCSGLVHMAYRRLGRLVPRDADQQEEAGDEVDPADAPRRPRLLRRPHRVLARRRPDPACDRPRRRAPGGRGGASAGARGAGPVLRAFLILAAAAALAGCGSSDKGDPSRPTATIRRRRSRRRRRILAPAGSTPTRLRDAARMFLAHSGPQAAYPADLYFVLLRDALADFRARDCDPAVLGAALDRRLTPAERQAPRRRPAERDGGVAEVGQAQPVPAFGRGGASKQASG